MLYLEDYLEMIEHLPVELRDRFYEIREMDLEVQNRVDKNWDRQKTFFSNCKDTRRFKPNEREEEYEKIRAEYKKIIEDANDKVQIAEDCYTLVDRYLRKLDDELLKFKCELEADNRGITEILEKQSLELDAPSRSNNMLNGNRHPKKTKKIVQHHQPAPQQHSQSSNDVLANLLAQSPSTSFKVEFDPSMGTSGHNNSLPNSSFSLQHIGAGGNAIAAAASQAIAATQQLSGRRSSSLKASYEAINLGLQSNEFSIGRELAGAAQAAVASTNFESQQQQQQNTKKTKLKTNKSQQQQDLLNSPGGFLDVLGGQDNSNQSFGASTDQEWGVDPNEPRYCICNQISCGDMVACDNEDCPLEWFHYPCVGITAPPKGKWYCPTCTANMSRRKKK